MKLPGSLLCLAVLPAAAHAQWTASPQIQTAASLGTMGDYLGRGSGFGLALRNGPGPLRLKVQATWTRFGSRTVFRPINGTGPAIGITSSATIVLLQAGPEIATRAGGVRLAAGAAAGVANVQSTGSTLFAGDPQQVNRSTSFSTPTWAASAYASAGMRLTPRIDAMVEGSLTQLGRTKFLREYNLPTGVISGMYLYPTPYSPRFAALSLSLRVGI